MVSRFLDNQTAPVVDVERFADLFYEQILVSDTLVFTVLAHDTRPNVFHEEKKNPKSANTILDDECCQSPFRRESDVNCVLDVDLCVCDCECLCSSSSNSNSNPTATSPIKTKNNFDYCLRAPEAICI